MPHPPLRSSKNLVVLAIEGSQPRRNAIQSQAGQEGLFLLIRTYNPESVLDFVAI